MTTPATPQEPLNNVELESAILGLRMCLTPEEEAEARDTFRDVLRRSTLAVPTRTPVATQPNGQIQEGAGIEFLIVETAEKVSGIPAFTALVGLQTALKDVPNGVFLTGAQLAGILLDSPHVLFIDGPDMHVETTRDDLKAIADASQAEMVSQQQAMQENKPLEDALRMLAGDDLPEHREAVIKAFLGGFCRIPVAGDDDKGAQCIVLHLQNPNDPNQAQDVPLLTEDGAVICFTGEDAKKVWDPAERNDIVLPGPAVNQMLSGTEVKRASINPGTATGRVLRLDENRLVVL
jgi:hypothetical protein